MKFNGDWNVKAIPCLKEHLHKWPVRNTGLRNIRTCNAVWDDVERMFQWSPLSNQGPREEIVMGAVALDFCVWGSVFIWAAALTAYRADEYLRTIVSCNALPNDKKMESPSKKWSIFDRRSDLQWKHKYMWNTTFRIAHVMTRVGQGWFLCKLVTWPSSVLAVLRQKALSSL